MNLTSKYERYRWVLELQIVRCLILLHHLKFGFVQTEGYNNTSQVTEMKSMFYYAGAFDQDISVCDVSN